MGKTMSMERELTHSTGFEAAFAPEIEAFTPPQTNRDTMLPSPTVATPVSPNFGKHAHQYSTNSTNGNNAEVSTVQPVSLRQGRGARLSFLGGRKKNESFSAAPPSSNGEPLMSPSTVSGDFSNPKSHESASGGHGHRLSFFRSPSSLGENHNPNNHANAYGVSSSMSNGTLQQSNGPLTKSGTEGSDWVTESGTSRTSHDTQYMSNSNSHGATSELIAKERDASGGAATPKLGGMKKRLSLLKLGKRAGRSHTMGAVSEE